MKPRTAIIILITILLVALVAIYILYIRSNEQIKSKELPLNKNQASQIENGKEVLSPEEQKKENLIQKEIEEKKRIIDNKTPEEIKTEGYTRDEADFILNPRGNIERELNLNQNKTSNELTQDEINAILNSKE